MSIIYSSSKIYSPISNTPSLPYLHPFEHPPEYLNSLLVSAPTVQSPSGDLSSLPSHIPSDNPIMEPISAPTYTTSHSTNEYPYPLSPKQTQNQYSHIIFPTQEPSVFPSPLLLYPTYAPFFSPSTIRNTGPSTIPITGYPNLLISPVQYVIL